MRRRKHAGSEGGGTAIFLSLVCVALMMALAPHAFSLVPLPTQDYSTVHKPTVIAALPIEGGHGFAEATTLAPSASVSTMAAEMPSAESRYTEREVVMLAKTVCG